MPRDSLLVDWLGLQGSWTRADPGSGPGCHTRRSYLDWEPACCQRTCCLQMGPGSGSVIPALGKQHSPPPLLISSRLLLIPASNFTFPSSPSPLTQSPKSSSSSSLCSLTLTFRFKLRATLSSHLSLIGSTSLAKIPSVCVCVR